MVEAGTAWISAHWPAPARIHAGITTRHGGYSQPPFEHFNLAQHVGDATEAVSRNRGLLRQQLHLPAEPAWLQQVHGTQVIEATQAEAQPADAAWTRTPGIICTVMTADCLPLLLCDRAGSCVAAVHVGWRGLTAGIIQAAISTLPVDADRLLAWLGPCIGPGAYEVGADVYAACQQGLPGSDGAFRDSRPGHWWADLPALSRLALTAAGVRHCSTSGLCTYSQPATFYSHRRDGKTGRMASLIWID